VSVRLGSVDTTDGDPIEVDITLEAAPSVLFDGVVIPAGKDAIRNLTVDGRSMEFVKDQYRHCKPMLALGDGVSLLEKAGIPLALPNGQPDPGLITAAKGGGVADAFIKALARHRHFERETDPPRV
jgi:catalase